MEILLCELKSDVDFGKIADEWSKGHSLDEMKELFPDATLDAVPCNDTGSMHSVDEIAREWKELMENYC